MGHLLTINSVTRRYTVFENSQKKSHFTISRAKRATFIFLVDIFEFSRQKSTLESKSTILMIFGAKIQIFQKLTIELKKCHFWRENSNETILMIFIHCGRGVLLLFLSRKRRKSLFKSVSGNEKLSPNAFLTSFNYFSFPFHEFWAFCKCCEKTRL